MNLLNRVGITRKLKLDLNPTLSRAEVRTKILSKQGHFFAQQTLAVLAQADIHAQVMHWYVAPRYLGIGVRIADATKLTKAIGLADSVGYAAGVGDGSPEPPVMAMPLGFLLYYQFQLPEFIALNSGEELRLWKNVYVDDPRLLNKAVGVGPGGTVVDFNWEDAPHSLVAGMTNSGKTTLNRTILYTLMRQYSPEQLKIVIVDPSRDYTKFENEEHLLVPIVHTPDDIRLALRFFAHETHLRAAENIRDATRYLLVVDEADKPYVLGEEENLRNVQRSVREGRAFRCNALISTHKPDAVSLGQIKDELDNRFLGKVATSQVSGQLGAGLDLHKLTGGGDFKHQARSRSLRFQGAVTSDYKLERLARGEIKPLPTLPPFDAGALAPKKGRPTVELRPESVAYFLFYGSNRVGKDEAEGKLGLKLRGYEVHQDFSAKIELEYSRLQKGNRDGDSENAVTPGESGI